MSLILRSAGELETLFPTFTLALTNSLGGTPTSKSGTYIHFTQWESEFWKKSVPNTTSLIVDKVSCLSL